ncbi:cell wall metabolism sensor histidine kinase WalK [Motiliproteus sp. MSK22-1]|uniref:sensor histidine kinase n=1 Tax=Motiliproteus sp. MSK22-1 TaxID=1897630 RepID=UPI000976D464|nr:HAMP domain-containing histidine kinase [Motiliproteus sp. MSK22-1]OMH36241.1 hypothetical protein BGP75_09820 [Motiliproteus sp. MSK22-1]
MFSKLTDLLHRNTAVDLTLRFALLFLLCASVLFITVDYLLSRSQLEKDQQLINSFLESYQRLEVQAGIHKLELVIERDAPYFQRSAMRVELIDRERQTQLLVQPAGWNQILESDQRQENDEWQQAQLADSKIQLLFKEVDLQSGNSLRIGQSVAARKIQIGQYRSLVLQVMVPLFILGLMLTAWMNWHALRPVYDLIETVQSLRARDLKARVTVRNPRSELGKLAQLFNNMLAQIEGLINGMQQSLDSVAHDLRTPLARMRLSLESALSQPEQSRLKEALMDCAEESERIESMLKSLMDISEAESGILKLHLKPIDLGVLAHKTVELYRYVAEEKKIHLTLKTEAHCSLTADSMRMQQVLGNLLDNAIKYTPPGGLVSVCLKRRKDQIILEVQDNGIGIALADQPHVFKRLYRADQSRNEPGMGLGLCLVNAVVSAHQGSIYLNSIPGQESCFRVELPIGYEQ